MDLEDYSVSMLYFSDVFCPLSQGLERPFAVAVRAKEKAGLKSRPS
jgi:hypothetical protein